MHLQSYIITIMIAVIVTANLPSKEFKSPDIVSIPQIPYILEFTFT